MLTVETYTAPDSFGGVGLFSRNFIKKGTIIWEYNPIFDRFYTLEDYKNFDQAFNEHKYTYPARINGVDCVGLSMDNDRYTNHSETPNIGHIYLQDSPDSPSIEDVRFYPEIALTDILPNTELTADYRRFFLPGMRAENYKNINTGLLFLFETLV
jgi:hypothetical protein